MNGLKKCQCSYLGVVSFFVSFHLGPPIQSIVETEINLALNEKKPFLAIHLEETELPPGLRLRMGDLQAIIVRKMPVERYFSKVINTSINYWAVKPK